MRQREGGRERETRVCDGLFPKSVDKVMEKSQVKETEGEGK